MQNRLRVRRAELEVSQYGLAALLPGMSRDRLFRIEKGYAEPTDAEILAIAHALQTTVGELFPGLAGVEPSSEVA